MNSNDQNIWSDLSKSDSQALQKSLDLSLEEVEAYPLNQDRIAAIVAKADVVCRQTCDPSVSDIKFEKDLSAAAQSLRTPESISDLNGMLDEIDPLPLEKERILQIDQKSQKVLRSEQNTKTPTAPGRRDEQPSNQVRLLPWPKKYRLAATIAIAATILFPLFIVVWPKLNQTIPKDHAWDHLRGGTASSKASTVMFDGTTSYPKAHGQLTWDENIERWRFYAAGLTPTHGTSVYRIWLYSSKHHSASQATMATNSPRVDTSTSVNQEGDEQFEIIPITTFQIEDPFARVDLIIDPIPLIEIGRLSQQYWFSVTLEPKPDATQPTGEIVMVGQTAPFVSELNDDMNAQ